MADVTLGFTCRNPACEADLELELGDVTAGFPAKTYGDPSRCYPGEGADWSWPDAVACSACGTLHDETWMTATLAGRARELLEGPADEPDYDELRDAPDWRRD